MFDNVSPATKKIEQNLANLRQQQRRSQEMFNQHAASFAASAAAAYALARTLSAPIQAATEFSTQLEDIRAKADMSTEAITKLGRASRDIGLDTGQGASKITNAIDTLVGFGAVTPDQAVEMATPIGKAATAYGADPTDLATATNAMVQNFGIAVSDATLGLSMMAQSGKDGGFEIKDMANELPGATAAARALGMEGTDALASLVSWLQVARTNTASGPEAATNFMNFLQKVQAEQASKAFTAAGVDIGAEIKGAIANGQDPIEHALGIIQKLTGGDQQKIQSYFSDAQVLKFIAAALPNIERYNELNTGAQNAGGTLEKDFIARAQTPGAIQARFWASMENLSISIGDSLIPAITDFANSVTPMIDSVASFVDANQELVAAVIQITAALIGLKMLTSAMGMFKSLMAMQATAAAIAAGGTTAAATTAGGATVGAVVAQAGSLLSRVLGTAIVAAPAVVADLAIGGPNSVEEFDAQVKHQGEIKQQMWDAINGLMGNGPAAPARDMSLAMEDLRNEIALVKAEIAAIPPPAFDGAMDTAAPLRTNLARLEGELAIAGADAGQSLSDGFAGQVPGMASEMQLVMDRLRVIAASGVNIPMRVVGPQASPIVTRATIAGARASGGPVKGGSTYEINELGTEYFTPGVNGFIHKAGSFHPPTMPSLGGGKAGGTTTIGDLNFEIHLSNPTNADPATLSRLLGDQVGARLRTSFSNSGY